jgi:hypothetical protein
LLGCDSGNILTEDIEHYIHFEERNWPMIEDGDNDYYDTYNKEEYKNETSTLEELLRTQQEILNQDRYR